MSTTIETLQSWIADMAAIIKDNIDGEPHHYISFVHDPLLANYLVSLIENIDDNDNEEESPYYSSCVFALDICIAQLQTAVESGNKLANRTLAQLMDQLAQSINKDKHSLSFWLPVLNAFYDAHVELSDFLRDAYLNLASQMDQQVSDGEVDHLDVIRKMITELSDLSKYDIAENFFAQSYAMPIDFFADLIIDFYSIPEAQDIAILALLHPKADIRDAVVETFEQMIHTVVLSSESLSRLQHIKYWYPENYHPYFEEWIKIQRKKGVVFNEESPCTYLSIKATEVDGSGAQGIFIHLKHQGKNKICGLLYKQNMGIKDAWVTPPMSSNDVKQYYQDAFDDSVTLKKVDEEYLIKMTEHFLALTVANNEVPDLHLLEIQELLGINFRPRLIDVPTQINALSVLINPFTNDTLKESLKRSKLWLTTKSFTESWYIENANIDRLVNRCSSIVEGAKVCIIEEAIDAVFLNELEIHRNTWLFHFLWMALWAKVCARATEKVWQDSFLIAYLIHKGEPLHSIPVMVEICHQTVLNSIETMNERRTHLNRE